MDEVVILHIGVEGGGMDIHGRQVAGQWVFWTTGSSMGWEPDDPWQHWETEAVTDLVSLLPDKWYMWFPVEVHPEFKALLRTEYERAIASDEDLRSRCSGRSHAHERWLEMLS